MFPDLISGIGGFLSPSPIGSVRDRSSRIRPAVDVARDMAREIEHALAEREHQLLYYMAGQEAGPYGAIVQTAPGRSPAAFIPAEHAPKRWSDQATRPSFVEYHAMREGFLVPAEMWIAGAEPQQPEQRRQVTAVLERPAAVAYVLPPNLPPRDYLETAREVGLDAPAIIAARMHYWLESQGWPLYDYDRVMSYLQRLANRDARGDTMIVPFWAPLRSVDVDKRFIKPPEFVWGSSSTKAEVYNRPVPKHALEKVKILEREEYFGPGVLKFAVSDYAAVNPDPFLLCYAGNEKFILDVWDEPGW